ncbi:hypothetical protein ACVGVM_11535 [Pseudonocardia bannensis]|uniref:DUF3558 domain-containing protein n=1 Tax=Pseudonocardia bannensis TaxID=630973 RepID=A0A848DII0_9PSEU|nr:hypothetical protein [Pseudonocardia bannensis]NMH92502.1 hypothetical protein [Pseudonocardia bannensis]
MRGWAARRAVTGAVRVLFLSIVVGATAACGGGAVGSPELPVPTFADPSAVAAAGSADSDGALPDDCGRLLSVADLSALFARPIDSVTVRTVRGVPEPSVGRTGRVGCRYSGVADPLKGSTLLDLNVGRYTDAAAAAKQWRVNSAAERASEGNGREVPIGSAQAMIVERRDETVLMVAYGIDTLTFVLPRAATGPRPAADTLVDLALRVLPQVAATAPATPTPARPVAPVSAARTTALDDRATGRPQS